MKVGDTLAVTIQGHHVMNAEVVDVNTKDSTVELLIPGTRVVMGLQTSLAAPTVPEPTREVIIDGVDRVSDDRVADKPEPVQAATQAAAPTPAAAQAPVQTQEASDGHQPGEVSATSTQDGTAAGTTAGTPQNPEPTA